MPVSDPILSGHILVVGPCDLYPELESVLQSGQCQIYRAGSPGEALSILRQTPAIDLVIITPGQGLRSYTELCRNIRYGISGCVVAVIFFLPPELADQQTFVYQCGAVDCILAPAPKNEIALRLLNAVRSKRATDSLDDANSVIISLANAIEGKDAYTCGHVERVATYAVEIGKRMGVQGHELRTLRTGAMVHDIGKVAVPEHILNKPGKLDPQEFEIMKRHPVIGYEILKPLRTFREVVPIVRWHHERPNGTGYPDGLGGDELPLQPRIVAIADCFDALITDRPYRPAMPFEKCVTILRQGAEREDLDPILVDVMLDIVQTNTLSMGLKG